jgi:effector-binding domain-containing protein
MEAPKRKNVGPHTVACIEHTGPHDEIGQVYHELFAWAARAGAQPAGQPFTVFLEPPGEMDWAAARFEVCLPVREGATGSGNVQVKTLPATDVLSVVVEGPYSEIPAHYAEFLAWIDWQGASIAGPPREVYLVHPGPDGAGDPATFRTEIQFPVRPEP